jgi:prepilin-type N-terminal cleavage/methylation domain-containing protein
MIQSRRAGGFTLIEVICVVLIMAIAAAIVFAGLSNTSDLQAESAARTAMADLLYAQNLAIATQQNVYINFDLVNGDYSLCSSLPAGATTYLTNPVSQASYINTWTGTNWSLSLTNFSGNTAMCFDALGTPWLYNTASQTQAAFPTNAAAEIGITSGSKTVNITIQAITGEMSVQ